jgi:quinol monooxygenase YgiN
MVLMGGAQILELLTAMVKGVTAHEPRTLQYELFVQDDSDDIVMVEKYGDG